MHHHKIMQRLEEQKNKETPAIYFCKAEDDGIKTEQIQKKMLGPLPCYYLEEV